LGVLTVVVADCSVCFGPRFAPVLESLQVRHGDLPKIEGEVTVIRLYAQELRLVLQSCALEGCFCLTELDS
jgi:hypothetical protein